MEKSAGDLIKLGWGALTTSEDWPDWIDIEQQTVPSERVYEGVSVTFINHATFLIQVDGVNILTDPVYSERVSPFRWAGPRRVHAPGVALEDLPPIDVILISHNHYDHLDEEALRALLAAQEKPPLLLAGLGNGRLLSTLGASDQRDLDWEDSAHYGELEFMFTECRHRSGRGVSDQMKTLWGSFVIKTSRGHLYFAGDTGYGPHLKATGDRHGPFALALLPIGAYEPRWFMKDVHLNPEEAVKAHQDLRSDFSIGIHFGTFQLTYEARDQPVIDLSVALREQSIATADFQVMNPGETLTLGQDQTSRAPAVQR
jgi:L-ascorbate metabolism protein UlaG (beta-lactamase superfamily)